MAERIGIFGGTFDPPHLGHLILADEAVDHLRLNRLLWVLTPDPPHKPGQPISDSRSRLRLVRLAIRGNPAFEISRVDLDRTGPHYALDSMKILREQYPQAELIYLIGGDSLHDLPTWYRPAELVQLCHTIGVMRRPGDEVDLSLLESKIPGISAKIAWIDAPLLEISSSQIRQRAAAGQAFRYYVPPLVYRDICRTGLYRNI
jgi:nicotinate-nucleotide adenylyltransferase